MSRSNMVRLDDKEKQALENIKSYHFNTQNVAFGEVIRVLSTHTSNRAAWELKSSMFRAVKNHHRARQGGDSA